MDCHTLIHSLLVLDGFSKKSPLEYDLPISIDVVKTHDVNSTSFSFPKTK